MVQDGEFLLLDKQKVKELIGEAWEVYYYKNTTEFLIFPNCPSLLDSIEIFMQHIIANRNIWDIEYKINQKIVVIHLLLNDTVFLRKQLFECGLTQQ